MRAGKSRVTKNNHANEQKILLAPIRVKMTTHAIQLKLHERGKSRFEVIMT